jgi:HEAT repeats
MRRRSVLGIFIIACTAPYVSAVPVHSLDLEKATAHADLIVVGRVSAVDEMENTSLEVTSGTVVPATRYRATLKVDRVLKGDLESQNLFFEFYVPDYPTGLQGVASGQYSIFFLKRDRNRWEFYDPTNPDLPAAPDSEQPTGTPLDRVTATLAQVLGSTSATERDYFQVLSALGRLKTDLSRDLLRQAMERAPGHLRLEIARTLVSRDDTVGLGVVEEALLSPGSLPENLVASLAGSLRGIKDSSAVPTLSKLIASNNSQVRLGAAVALRQTASPAAITPLSRLLRDSDPEVLYYAVVGLGEITHQDEWTPAMDEFREHEKRYLAYWRQWAQSNSN